MTQKSLLDFDDLLTAEAFVLARLESSLIGFGEFPRKRFLAESLLRSPPPFDWPSFCRAFASFAAIASTRSPMTTAERIGSLNVASVKMVREDCA